MNNLVSVIVPIYNSEKYLEECLNSIINQTYKNLEIILINDGSLDKSMEICNLYKEKDNRVIVFDQVNKGVSFTRNFGISISKGDYIIFVDSDDYIELNMIEKMFSVITNEKVDVVRCANDIMKNKKRIINEKNPDNLCNKKIMKNNFYNIYDSLFSISGKKINCYSPLLMIKKEICPKFDDKIGFMEDVLFYVELLKNSNSFYFINDELYHYRYNDISSSKNIDNVEKNILDLILVSDKLKENIDKNDSQKLFELIDINKFYIYISKIDLIIAKNIKIKKNIFELYHKNIEEKVNYRMLNIIKKIEYMLLKNKLYKLFVFLEKIKISLKK